MKQIVFTKYSGERSREFAIRTDIVKEKQELLAVEKRPLYPEGLAHIQKIYRSYQLLQQAYLPEQFVVNKCQEISDGIRLEYLTGETLQEKIERRKEKKQEKEIEAYIEQYLERMTKNQSWIPFQPTQEFCQVFGEVSLPEDLKCQKITNIDMIFSNIILIGEKWHFIDYEWTFDFPIPIHFVLYRAFFLACNEIPGVNALELSAMLKRLGIGREEQRAYEKMEAHFQEYVRGQEKPLRDIITDMGHLVISMPQIEEALGEHAVPRLSVRCHAKTGWQLPKEVLPQIREGNLIQVTCSLPKDALELELQVAAKSCLVQIKQITATLRTEEEGQRTEPMEVTGLAANGMELANGLYLMQAKEAWVRFSCHQAEKLEILFQIQTLRAELNQDLLHHLNEQQKAIVCAQKENNRLLMRYDRVERSILFRMYLKLKELLGKADKNGETREDG